ncbi:MAG: RNA pyrophosphohydrolase [Paracoccaceae bacterium]
MTLQSISALPYRPCVGVMLANPAGRIFVGQRIDADTPAWQMPQGGIEPGEDPSDAALRELREETGITRDLVTVRAQMPEWLTYDLPHALVPNLWQGRFRGQKQRWFLMRFNGTDSQIDIQTKNPEFSEWTWLDPADLVANIVPFKREVYARVLAEFGDLLG